jgi:Family of unknown function (DUF5309)
MAYTVAEGLVDDQDILSNERVIDMDDVIDMLEVDITQFTTALMKVASTPATSSKVEWLEDRLFPRLSALAASATSAATSLDVTTDEGQYFNVGDVVRNAVSGEAYEVTGVTTDAIGVTRSIGSVAAATSASGAELVIIGNAYLQGARLGTPKVLQRVNQYNYTQIFRHPYSFTRTLTQSRLYGGSEPNKERKKKGIEHKRALENTFFFGARDLDTGGSEPQGFCGGLVEFITSNLHDPSGTMTASELDTFLQTDLQHGSMSKVAFISPTVARVISAYASSVWRQLEPSSTQVFGVHVDAYISGAYGYNMPVFVKKDWNDFATTSSQYGSWAFVVDMSAVKMRPLQSTVLLRNRQDNDADRVTEEYLTETSLEIQHEAKHAIIKNVTA